jgi:hypothetical protein
VSFAKILATVLETPGLVLNFVLNLYAYEIRQH